MQQTIVTLLLFAVFTKTVKQHILFITISLSSPF